MNPTDSINLLLQAARVVEVPDHPEVGVIAWRMACTIVQLQETIEKDEEEIRILRLQLQSRESASETRTDTDWSAA